jgi:hypothetical protein
MSSAVGAGGGGLCSRGPRRNVTLSVALLTVGTILLYGAPRPQHLLHEAGHALRHANLTQSTVDVALALLTLQVRPPPFVMLTPSFALLFVSIHFWLLTMEALCATRVAQQCT